MAKPLRTITLLNSIASSLSQPYFSFLNVIGGVTGPLLGIVSSSFTAFPSLVQGVFSLFRIRAKSLITYGYLLSGFAWILLSILKFGGVSTLVFVMAAVGSGSSTFGYALVLEEVSRGARGRVLSQYAQYARVGSLISTVGVGLVTGDQYSLMKWFFLATGVIYLASAWFSTLVKDGNVQPLSSGGVEKDVLKMIGINSVFYVAWSFAWPLFPLAEVYVYHMNEVNLALITLIGGVSGILLQRKVGEWMDVNRRLVMFIGRIGLATYPLVYSLAGNVYEIYTAYMMMGITGPANAIAYNSFIYDNTKDVRKGISFLSMGEGLGAILGSLLGSISFTVLEGLFPLTLVVRALLLSAAVMRIFASFLYLSIHDKREKRNNSISGSKVFTRKI